MQRSLIALGVVCSFFLVSCGDEPAAADAKPQPQAPQSERERQINNLQAAGVVGYDGEGIKRSVQKTVDTMDAHNADTEAAAQAASDGSK